MSARPLSAWRRVRRIALLSALACTTIAAVSYLPEMVEKHNVGVGVSSVEWLRQNGGNSIVSEIENWYYQLTAPENGGPTLTSLPKVGIAAAEGGEGAKRAYRPPRVKPPIRPALPGEGVWKPTGAHAGKRPPVLVTTFRSDPEYPRFVAGVAWMDARRTHLEYVPGLAEPPEPLEHRGTGEVPPGLRSRLVATFNSGFPLETSNAGLIYRGKVIESMVDGIATIVEYRDGSIDIVRWHGGEGAPANIWFASRTCRRSSTKASSTRTSATARNGAKPSTTRPGCGGPGSASTGTAT